MQLFLTFSTYHYLFFLNRRNYDDGKSTRFGIFLSAEKQVRFFSVSELVV